MTTKVPGRMLADVVSPEGFGARGNGVADDTAAFANFLNACAQFGIRGHCRAGAIYRLTGTYARNMVSGETLSVDFNGSTLFQDADVPLISLVNGGTVTNVSAVANVLHDLGDGGVSTQVTRITAAGHGFAVGDVGKIFSDDVVPDTDRANQYCGEFFVVGAVSGNDIYTTGQVIETYATTIRVAKPSDAVVSFRSMDVKSTIADSIAEAALNISGFIRPVFDDTSMRSLNAIGMNLIGCYQARIDGIAGEFLKNRPDLGALGYLVNDNGSFQTTVQNIRCSYARHAYTTNSPSAVLGDNDWRRRGRTIDCLVIDGRALGCAVSFDTHSPALGVRFKSCTSMSDYRGNQTSGAAFQIRGNDCDVIDCSARNSKLGVSVIATDRPGEHRTRVVNFDYDGQTSSTPVRIVGFSNANLAEVEFSGRITTKNELAFDVRQGVLTINGIDARMDQATNSSCVVMLTADAKVFWTGGHVDYAGASGTGLLLVDHAAATTEARVADVRVKNNSGKLQYFARTQSFQVPSRFSDVLLDAAIGVPFNTSITLTDASASYSIWKNIARPLQYKAITHGTTGNKTVDLEYSGHDNIAIRNEASAAGVIINVLTVGAYRGQTLILSVRETSANSIQIANNSGGLLTLGAAVTLAAGESMMLYWDGATWRVAAK